MKMLYTKGEIEKLQEDEAPLLKRKPEILEQGLHFTNGDGILDLGEDPTFSCKGYQMIYLTEKFKNGFFLGFWTHSPWGGTTDQEKGWAIINPITLEVEEDIATRSGGIWCPRGEFSKWRKSIKEKYGKSKILLDGFGERPWKMGRD